MGYTLPQIAVILAKADRTMYKIGAIAYDDMFNQLDESLDYDRDIIYIYKVAVEYADNFYVGTDKLDTVVERLGAKVAVYDFGQLTPIYSDSTIVTQVVPVGAALNDLSDVTITNLQDQQTLKYNAALGQWVNVGTGNAVRNTQQFTATSGQTTFTTAYQFDGGLVDIFVNGVKLSTPSYTVFGNYTIILTDGCVSGDIVEIVAYENNIAFIDLSAYYVPVGRTITINGVTYDLSANRSWTTVSSVGISMPSAFTVSNSPVTTSGTLTVTGAGTTAQYIRGDGSLATFPALTGYVPYTGASGDVNLGEFELKAGQVEFDQTPTGAAGIAVMRWNDTDGTVDLGLKGGNVTLQMGQELVQRVVNKSGASLLESAYQVVKVITAQGQRLAIDLAQGNNDANSADTLGIVTETISNNQEGFITTSGLVRNINTTGSLQGETWADGDVLYLSPTVPGAITKVKPIAPNHSVILGYVVYAHANNGKIFVKVDNGYEIGELHDVNTTGAVNGNVLKYNGTIWIPSSDTGITSLNGLTALSQTFATGISGTDFGISSSTSTHTFNLPIASGTNTGKLSNTDWSIFNSKQNAITLTTTGTSGASTFISNTLNVPTYTLSGLGGVPTSRTLTINGTAFDLSADRSWTVSGTNIYTADGTLTSNRTITSGGYTLTFTGNIASNSNVRAKGANDGTATGASTHIDFITASNYGRVQVYNYTTPALLPLMLSASEVSIGGSPASSGFALNVQGTNAALFSSADDVSIALRSGATTSSQIFFQQSTTSKFSIGYVQSTAGLRIYNWELGSPAGAIFSGTNNWSIGSTTDAGYKLDVNGTARVSGDALVANNIRVGFGAGASIAQTNTALGYQALNVISTGNNTAIGYEALKNCTDGNNTAVGQGALKANTSGISNTAIGAIALGNNTTGFGNIGIGVSALNTNTTGSQNVAIGNDALRANNADRNNALGSAALTTNTSGTDNSAFGNSALRLNQNGLYNAAIGTNALFNNISGSYNVAIGGLSMQQNTTASNNTAIGVISLQLNTTGENNTSLGYGSLLNNTTGGNNTAIGFSSGRYAGSGTTANQTSSNSIYVGYQSRASASGNTNEIVIGYNETGLGSNTTIIGNSSTITTALRGRLLLGTTVDSGLYQLDVNGTARVSGNTLISGVLQETITTNRQTASYTLALTDRGKLVEMNVATANNLTVPLNSSIAFPIGSKIDLSQYGAGQTTVVATGGVTVRSAGGALKLALQYSGASLVKIATNEWYLFGDITV